VIINPVSAWVFKDRRAANIPTLNTVDSRIDASALNPAVPYDNFTPEKKKKFDEKMELTMEKVKMGTLRKWVLSRRVED
jgi:hypothetical protein